MLIAKCRLDRLVMRVLFSSHDLPFEAERCWKLGLMSELLTNVARHAQFDDRHPESGFDACRRRDLQDSAIAFSIPYALA
jgi:hypothetical protein